jgi:MFS family permease
VSFKTSKHLSIYLYSIYSPHKDQMYGAVDDEDVNASPISSAQRTAASSAVLHLGLLTFLTANLTTAAVFSFFPVVVQEKAGSTVIVGLMFASQPLALALVSPFVPYISQKFGRITTLCIGLIFGALSNACFGYIDDFKLWFVLRCIQGVSNAFVDGPSMALLLAYSTDLAQDLGYMESVAGLSFVIGPAVGGILYASCGFQNTFLVLGACYIVCLAFVPYLTYGSQLNISATSKEEEEEEEAASTTSGDEKVLPTKTTVVKDGEKEKKDEDEEEFSPWSILAKEPSVWISSAVAVLIWTTADFYDVYLSGELKQTLGIGARARGLIYVWPALTYGIFSLFLGAICRKIGAKNALLFGSWGHMIVCLLYGPNVYVVAAADYFGLLESNHGRDFAWNCIFISMGIWGFAMAPLFQATLPLVHAALAAKGHLKVNDGMMNMVMNAEVEAAERKAAVKREKLEDALSALQQTACASGQILGPVLGGLALEYLPKANDPGCVQGELFTELDDSASTASIDCETGFAWATTIIAGLFFIMSLFLMTLPNYKSVEEFDGEVVTMEMLTNSPVVRRRSRSRSRSRSRTNSAGAVFIYSRDY